MLTVNIDVSDGLVNGARGTVEAIIKTGNQFTVLVQFEHDRVGVKAKSHSHTGKSTPMLYPSTGMKLCSTLAGTEQLKSVDGNFLSYWLGLPPFFFSSNCLLNSLLSLSVFLYPLSSPFLNPHFSPFPHSPRLSTIPFALLTNSLSS